MTKPELLAPAGDLIKLKTAILYGADAVFIGGKNFSLRAKASNFELNDIKEGVLFAHTNKKKIYVTVNIYPYEDDLEGLDEYLLALDACEIDAIIVSSFYIISRAITLKCKFAIHLSTQQSVANSESIKFYKDLGVQRVVLARECTLEEIKLINEKKILDLEVFIHGGLCASYSGRCTLSNHMTNRDANRGGCAHSCRWEYELFKNNQLQEETFMIGSKDLLGTSMILSLMKIGITSFKIEGRMKSLNYIASVVSAYRMLIDEIYSKKLVTEELLKKVNDLICKAENRETTTGYLKGEITTNDIIYNINAKTASQEFIGVILEYDKDKQLAKVHRKNYFTKNLEAEILFFDGTIRKFMIEELYDEEMKEIDIANKSDQVIYMKIPFEVTKNLILRKY